MQMSESAGQSKAGERKAQPAKKSIALTVFKVGGVVILIILLVVLLVNALLSIFKDRYYPTFGRYRLFAIVSDSMSPTIPTGHMIVGRIPKSPDEIFAGENGSVITFEVRERNGDITLITHRVVDIAADGSYITRGDNAPAEDGYRPKFEDVVGVYTGSHCGFFGYFFGFLYSTQGVICLLLILFVIILAWTVLYYVRRTEERRRLAISALKKAEQSLSGVNLRYDNIHEITAVMDVLSMVTDEPKSRADAREIRKRLQAFINAENIELPQTPETAAILDSLPAPDTPGTLAAALAAGATLRQAEDGQTLVLTTVTGGRNILLTPVQTSNGIVLYQQGVHMRSEIAPNIEEVGIMSMPGNPEFFEGQPLERHVEYPELPQPAGTFGPSALSPRTAQIGASGTAQTVALSSPVPVGQSRLATGLESARTAERGALPTGGNAETAARKREAEMREKADAVPAPAAYSDVNAAREAASLRAYAQYRETAAQLELRQAEQLSVLLAETAPLSETEKARIAEYKAANKKEKKPSKPRTPEQKAAAKAAAEKRKVAQEAFLSALSPTDREIYETEQKLNRARAAAIKRLRGIANDRKLLEKLDGENK